jgi:CheY-like chemotaxis protein
MANFILVAEDEELFRDLLMIAVENLYDGEVLGAANAPKAIEILKARNEAPDVLITDFEMQGGNGNLLANFVSTQWPSVPIVVVSSRAKEDIKESLPGTTIFIDKMDAFAPLRNFLQGRFRAEKNSRNYIPIRLGILVEMTVLCSDFYLKLGENNYVRFLQKADLFLPEDAKKLLEKRVANLYLAENDAPEFFASFQAILNGALKKTAPKPEELALMGVEFLDTTQKLAKSFGWTEEVVVAAQKSIAIAIKAVEAAPAILDLIVFKHMSSDTKAVEHVTVTSLLACAIAQRLEWASEITQTKLAMAALLHDLTVEDGIYQDIDAWNQRASDRSEQGPAIEQYRNHMKAACEKILQIPNLPPDLDQIIIQHHERPDGTGFPNGIGASRISPLSAVFIFAEDMALFLLGHEDAKGRAREFIKQRGALYETGAFRKILKAFAQDLAK